MSQVASVIQQAVIGHLSSDAALSGMVSGVFHSIVQDTPLPYLYLNRLVIRDQSPQTGCVGKASWELEAFSNQPNNQELLTISERVTQLLHRVELSLEGGGTLYVRHERTQIEQQVRARLFHARIQFSGHYEC